MNANELIKAEIIKERLKGDERLWKRWATNNAAYLDYRIRLKRAELDGTVSNVQAIDAQIQKREEGKTWKPYGANSVISPSGTVMTKRLARLAGWEDEE